MNECAHDSQPNTPSGDDFRHWISEVRMQEIPEIVSPPQRRRLPAWLYAIAFVGPGGLLALFWGMAARPAPLTTAVLGTVVDADHHPIADALVFSAARPEQTASTGADGRFELAGLPPGRACLVVVVAGVGTEFSIQVPSAARVDIGELGGPALQDR